MTFNIILALATWRITNLLVNEDGPGDILIWVRCWIEKYTTVLTCEWCTSMWVGLVAALFSVYYYGQTHITIIPTALAYSATSIFITVLLERVQCEAIMEPSSL